MGRGLRNLWAVLVPAVVASHLGGSGQIFTAWLLGGAVALVGALALAELGAAMPQAGGPVVYLSRAFGPVWGYLYGWSAFAVTNTAGVGAIAVAFATYLGFFVPLGETGVRVVAIAAPDEAQHAEARLAVAAGGDAGH